MVKYEEKFYGCHTALTPAVVKSNREYFNQVFIRPSHMTTPVLLYRLKT